MEYTTNYQLNQWDAQDAIKRTDFNADNAKIDAALGKHSTALTEHAAALALCGNCKIAYGSYRGTGTYGSANPNTLTFEHKPLLVVVMPEGSTSDASIKQLLLVYGSKLAWPYENQPNAQCAVAWTDTTVSWYVSQPNWQFNSDGYTYCYVALLAADK